jgi:hypothetical protein
VRCSFEFEARVHTLQCRQPRACPSATTGSRNPRKMQVPSGTVEHPLESSCLSVAICWCCGLGRGGHVNVHRAPYPNAMRISNATIKVDPPPAADCVSCMSGGLVLLSLGLEFDGLLLPPPPLRRVRSTGTTITLVHTARDSIATSLCLARAFLWALPVLVE